VELEIAPFGLITVVSHQPKRRGYPLRMPDRQKPNTKLIEDLAQQSDAPVELVAELYESEVTKLKAEATVENYIGVIASKRVKRKLRSRRRPGARAR